MVSTVDTISFVSHGVFVSFYVYSYVYFSKLMGDLFSQSSTMSKFNFIHQIFNIYFTLFLYNLITSLMNINLGIYKFYINFMGKAFEFISRNENIFLDFNATEELDGQSSIETERNGDASPMAVSQSPLNSQETETKKDFNTNGHANSICPEAVEKCFAREEPEHWNMLHPYGLQNGKRIPLTLIGTIVWTLGAIVRFTFLVPIRLSLFIYSIHYLIAQIILVLHILPQKLQPIAYKANFPSIFSSLTYGPGGYLRVHDSHIIPKESEVLVSNHTTPLDIVFAGSHRTFGWFGRFRDGFLGFVYHSLTRNGGHLWFDLREKDSLPAKIEERLKDKRNYPIIIYPEGTCTTTNVIMRFRKGWFDIASRVYPFATKYDIRYGPVFWNSKTTSLWAYVWQLSQNWAAVCDMYFLSPMEKKDNESGVEFAERVRCAIADKINLKKVDCDGYSIKYNQKKVE